MANKKKGADRSFSLAMVIKALKDILIRLDELEETVAEIEGQAADGD